MRLITFMKGICLGAGMMYLFDPDMGRRRRAIIRDKATHVWNEAGDKVEATSRDLSNRVTGVIVETTNRIVPRSREDRKAMWSGRGAAWLPSNWSPTARLLLTAGAGLLALYGQRRGGVLGTTLGAVSLGLITQSISKTEALDWTGYDDTSSCPEVPESMLEEGNRPRDLTAEHQPRTSPLH